MSGKELSRRKFIGVTAAGIAGAAVTPGTHRSAASYNRIIGANDRINIGFLGCGARSSGHRRMVKMSEKDKNLGVVAVCDIWKLNREKAASDCRKMFNAEVKQFKYSEDMLSMPEIDAVMIANGGIFGWPDIRQNPDTFQALATYDDAKLLYSYTSNYANRFGDYTCIRGKEGTLFAHGGEGSARWFYVPEHQDLPGGFDFFEGMKEAVKSGKAMLLTTDERGMKPGPVVQSDDSKFHLDNWINCIRSVNQSTNGNIHTGYWNAIASVMATYACREGKKLYWDNTREEIVDHPVKG